MAELNSCPAVVEEKPDIESYVSKAHVIASESTPESQTTSCKSVHEGDEDETMLQSVDNKEVLSSQEAKSPDVIVKYDPDPVPEETPIVLEEVPDLCTSETPEEIISQIPETVSTEIVEEEIEKSEEIVSDVPEEEVSHIEEDRGIEEACKIDNNTVVDNQSSCENVPLVESITDSQSVINSEPKIEETTTTTTNADGEPQIPEEMEIDSETLRRIHELEVMELRENLSFIDNQISNTQVRGEMREVYEEISGCPENLYPILESMEIGSSTGGEGDNPVIPAQGPVNAVPCAITTGNEEDAFIDANNYVLESREITNELLGCSWTDDPTVNNVVVASVSG